MIAVQTVWVEMGYVEEAMRQMKSQVFLIWRGEECYTETGDGTKVLVTKKQD